MRYNHLDMLPEKAFSPVGKRMTLEGGGGLGKVAGIGANLAMGSSPLSTFGGALGSEIAGNMFGGGGGGGGSRGPYAPGQPGSSNPYGMGTTQNYQGFGMYNNGNGRMIGYPGGMPTQGGAFGQYANHPLVGDWFRNRNMTPEEYAAHEAAERAARGQVAPRTATGNPAADYGMTNVLPVRPVPTPMQPSITPVRPYLQGLASLQQNGVK